MCAFFSFLNYSPSQFRKKFNVDKLDEKEFERLQSIKFFPTANIATISQNSPNSLVARRFGLIPHWYRKPLNDWKASTHNARAESVDEKPTYRHAWSNNQRCLIPVTFWIESQENENEKAPKIPWKISVKGEDAVGIAGIYEDIPDAEGNPIPTCSMITTESIKPLSEVHDRQIVVIKE
jgi:putative SOS response-associated peptidase YedK